MKIAILTELEKETKHHWDNNPTQKILVKEFNSTKEKNVCD